MGSVRSCMPRLSEPKLLPRGPCPRLGADQGELVLAIAEIPSLAGEGLYQTALEGEDLQVLFAEISHRMSVV